MTTATARLPWCPRCRLNVRTFGEDERCVRCGAETVPRRPGEELVVAPRANGWRRNHGKLADDQLKAAYVLYARKELSVRQVAALLWERFGYASQNACAKGLFDQFRRNGWPLRDRVDAVVASNKSRRLAPEGLSRAQAKAWNRRRRGEVLDRPACAHVYPRKGRCRRLAQRESPFCFNHDPARHEEIERILADARGRAPEPTEDFMAYVRSHQAA